ncbi:unnamed protein product [Amoebophrya sp. A25]|nr:unnamed protein product [Amoebophrya sp. A25]|eukprot:GSA25T00005168001.1
MPDNRKRHNPPEWERAQRRAIQYEIDRRFNEVVTPLLSIIIRLESSVRLLEAKVADKIHQVNLEQTITPRSSHLPPRLPGLNTPMLPLLHQTPTLPTFVQEVTPMGTPMNPQNGLLPNLLTPTLPLPQLPNPLHFQSPPPESLLPPHPPYPSIPPMASASSTPSCSGNGTTPTSSAPLCSGNATNGLNMILNQIKGMAFDYFLLLKFSS